MAGTTAKKTLAEALIEFQKDLPSVGLDGENPHFKSKFATLGNVTKEVLPKLTANGLSYSVGSFVENGTLILDARLLHESGEFRSMHFPITATDPQKVGSAVTYYRRYALAALTGVVADVDDDGNTASQQTVGEKRAATVAQPATPATQAAKKTVSPSQERIRVEYVEKGKIAPAEVNAIYDKLKASGLNSQQAFDQILKDLEAAK